MRPFEELRTRTPALFYGLVVLVAVELVAAIVAPQIVPGHVYLRSYLGPRSRAGTDRLLAGTDRFLLYDSLLGWRSRPGASYADWRIDSVGSRSTHAFGLAPSGRTRVLFLGSSLVNGGTGVRADQTLSACVEDSTTEALNFATMLYSLDQTYLSYVSSLYRYDPATVVVGLPSDPAEGLANRYVPFRLRSEWNLPFFKPRFELRGDSLALVPVPSRRAYAGLLRSDDLLHALRSSDADYGAFFRYEHFGFTPLASALSALYVKARSAARLAWPGDPEMDLALELMRRLREVAAGHGAGVVFALLPSRAETFPSPWRRRLPDPHPAMVAVLRRNGLEVFDGRDVLRRSGRRAAELYKADGVHFTPLGNRLLGRALRPLLARGRAADGTPSPRGRI